MAPLTVDDYGNTIYYIITFVVGLGFGTSLELSGFGDSRKLAAQFYLKDLTVFKVMFTAIVVAMTLLFFSSAIGIVNFDEVWVNPTYLWPGIAGGFIMGIGFIIGGFCPGTSVVALATFKIDGMFFVGGVAFGVFLFGESVWGLQDFYYSSYMGRFTLPDAFGISTGLVVVLVIFMALVMFYWAEIAEKFFGEKIPWKSIDKGLTDRWKLMGAALLVVVGFLTLLIGQPTLADKWEWIKDVEQKKISTRQIHAHPVEVFTIMNDPLLYSTILDVRSESDYNLFHIEGARNVTMQDFHDKSFIKKLNEAPANTIVFVISNGEERALEAYRYLRAQNVINVYIISGGINNWLDVFGVKKSIAVIDPGIKADDVLKYSFHQAVGEKIAIANPRERKEKILKNIKFKKTVKIQKKKAISGGCG